eukprot:g3175.t1
MADLESEKSAGQPSAAEQQPEDSTVPEDGRGGIHLSCKAFRGQEPHALQEWLAEAGMPNVRVRKKKPWHYAFVTLEDETKLKEQELFFKKAKVQVNARQAAKGAGKKRPAEEDPNGPSKKLKAEEKIPVLKELRERIKGSKKSFDGDALEKSAPLMKWDYKTQLQMKHGYVKTAVRSITKLAQKRCEKLGRAPPSWCSKEWSLASGAPQGCCCPLDPPIGAPEGTLRWDGGRPTTIRLRFFNFNMANMAALDPFVGMLGQFLAKPFADAKKVDATFVALTEARFKMRDFVQDQLGDWRHNVPATPCSIETRSRRIPRRRGIRSPGAGDGKNQGEMGRRKGFSVEEEGAELEQKEKDKSTPPLERMSQRKAGSVLQAFVNHMRELLQNLDEGSLVPDDSVIGGVSAVKYFHLQIKPAIGAKSREAREIYCLLQGIDLLRSGKLDQLGDLVAARAMAVHQSVTDGGSWRAAKHLEIRPLETGTAANTSLILQARKFAKVSDRAAGLTPTRPWVPRPYGKGGKDWHDEAFLGTSIVREDGLRLCFFGTHFPMQRLQSVLVSNKIDGSEKLMAAKIEYARVLREVLCRAAAWDFGHNTVIFVQGDLNSRTVFDFHEVGSQAKDVLLEVLKDTALMAAMTSDLNLPKGRWHEVVPFSGVNEMPVTYKVDPKVCVQRQITVGDILNRVHDPAQPPPSAKRTLTSVHRNEFGMEWGLKKDPAKVKASHFPAFTERVIYWAPDALSSQMSWALPHGGYETLGHIDGSRFFGSFTIGRDPRGEVEVGFILKILPDGAQVIGSIQEVPLVPAPMQRLCAMVSSLVAKSSFPIYDRRESCPPNAGKEGQRKGVWRTLLARVNPSNEMLVMFQTTSLSEEDRANFVEPLLPELEKLGVTSVFLQFNDEVTDAARPTALARRPGGTPGCVTQVHGKPRLEMPMLGLKLEVGPLSFFNPNTTTCRFLMETALAFLNLKKTEILLDIFCGIGTIGLCAAHCCEKVIGVDVVEENIEDVAANAISNTEFLAGKAEELVPKILGDMDPSKEARSWRGLHAAGFVKKCSAVIGGLGD